MCEREPAPPSQALPASEGAATLSRQLEGDLDHIVLMALRKEPARRYASAGQLAEDVRRYLEGRPVIARADTFGYRSRKFIARNRVPVAGAAVCGLLLLGGAGVTLWQSRLRAEALVQAEAQRTRATRLASFMVGVFDANDPNEARGRTVTARALLDRAAGQLSRDNAIDPALRAHMDVALGRAYASLGLLQRASAQLDLATVEHRVSGPANPDLTAALAALAEAVRQHPVPDHPAPSPDSAP